MHNNQPDNLLDSSNNKEFFTFTWEIENFNSYYDPLCEFITSPAFQVEELEDASFHLRVFPRGISSGTNDIYCDICRSVKDDGPGFTRPFQLKLSADLYPSSLEVTRYIPNANHGSTLHSGTGLYIPKQTLLQHEDINLPNGTLTLQCVLSADSIKLNANIHCTAKTVIQTLRHVYSFPIKTIPSSSDSYEIVDFNAEQKHSISFGKDFKVDIEFLKIFTSDKDIQMKVSRLAKLPKRVFFYCKIFLEQKFTKNRQLLTYQEHYFNPEESLCLFTDAIEASKFKMLSPYSKVCLRCEFSSSDGVTKHRITSIYRQNYQSNKTALGSMSNDSIFLKNMYEDKKYCDVTLVVGDESFPAHKCFLCGRSPVFSAMFNNNMKEKETNRVEIEDLSAKTVNHMLHFIYTGSLNELQPADVIELYSAADKYQILELKEMCLSIFSKTLNNENIYDALESLHLFQQDDLNSVAFNFICLNAKKLFCCSKWKNFMEKNSHLAGDIMHEVYLKLFHGYPRGLCLA